jgi:hypothetical protein
MRAQRVLKKRIIYACLAFFLFSFGCSDEDIVAPGEQNFGLRGRIIDSSGAPIEGVEIFCLYFQSYVPESGLKGRPTSFQRLDTGTRFDFKLYQNFPNPFSHSTFIRFALPQDSEIELTIRNKRTNTIVFTKRDTLLAGLYQRYIEDIVGSNNLRNGIYRYILTAEDTNGTRYMAEEEMAVVSDAGEPNSMSFGGGMYFFDYRDAFVGDSVRMTTTGEENQIYSVPLDNQVNLLIRKSGYLTNVISIGLYPTLLLNQDIVLLKGNGL